MCPYLVKGYLFNCVADCVPHVISLERLRMRCFTPRHYGCRYFKGQHKKPGYLHALLWEE